ncbi:MAG: hypothetical protein RIC95_02520 [Vicingaceae bacterium]
MWSCESKTESCNIESSIPPKKSLNPNEDSKLALLMRSMFEEAETIRTQIENSKILSAHATEPEKVTSPEYKVLAQLYLNQFEELKGTKVKTAEVHFKSMIENCMSCHQELCKGPW